MQENYLETELGRRARSDATLSQFLQGASFDGLWYLDIERPGNEWISPALRRLLGLDRAPQMPCRSVWTNTVHPGDLNRAQENTLAHCADPDVPFDQILRYAHSDGSTVWVRCRGIALRDDAGRAIRMLMAHHDLTALRLAEEDARTARIKAEIINEELNAFVYGTSHELKSPVNTLRMLIDEIHETDNANLNDDQRDLIAMAGRTVSQMCTLVEDLSDFTRLIGVTPVIQAVALADVIDALEEDIEAARADVVIGALPVCAGDSTQIQILLHNLVANAIKYRAPDRRPRVDVAASEVQGMVILKVADNGVGISPEHFGRIFGLFNRLHRTSEIAGSGLGLTLCRRIVQNHSGEISVASTPGQGSTFTVTLPKSAVQGSRDRTVTTGHDTISVPVAGVAA